MKNYHRIFRMRASYLVILLIAFFGLISMQTTISQRLGQEASLCGDAVSGLLLCTNDLKKVVKFGDPIVLNFSLENVSENAILVRANRDSSNFVIALKNSEGESVQTKLERVKRQGYMSDEESAYFINSHVRNHKSVSLAPKNMIQERVALGDFYDPIDIGLYTIEIRRVTLKASGEGLLEIPLKPIKLEIISAGVQN